MQIPSWLSLPSTAKVKMMRLVLGKVKCGNILDQADILERTMSDTSLNNGLQSELISAIAFL
jgi:hypothetical protein